MVEGKYLKPTQKDINSIWTSVWSESNSTSNIFKNRLFLESYSVYKKYIPSDTENLLEIGTGTGRYAVSFAKDFNIKVTASDILLESLELARKLAIEEKVLNRIIFIKEDVLELSMEDNYFDVVFSDAVIQHIPDYEKAVIEMARVLKPGGRLIISSVNKNNPHTLFKFLVGYKYEYGYEKSFSVRELKELMSLVGLKVIATDGYYVSYGIERLKRVNRCWIWPAKIINKISKIIDRLTNRWFTKKFGFEILVVATKL